MKETALYAPVKRLLEAQGYSVKGEVRGCDVVATRGEEGPVVVELKTTLSLSLLLQAVDRLALSGAVYLAVPGGCAPLRRDPKRIRTLLRMLGLGLLTVSGGRASVWLDPGPYAGPRISRARQARLLGEFRLRAGDPEPGGADRRRGLHTAYRQRALRIAGHLRDAGPCRARDVAAALGDPAARDLLYRDVYGWFSRPSRGIYALNPEGERALSAWGGG